MGTPAARRLRIFSRGFTTLIIVISLTGSSLSQPQRSGFPEDRTLVLIQPTVMLGVNGRHRLDVLYGIPADFFIFTRDVQNDPEAPFIAKGDITVEVFDSSQNSIARKIVQRKIDVTQPPAPGAKGELITGFLTFDIAPGIHRVFFELIDTKSNRRYADSSKRVAATEIPDGTIRSGGIIFFKPTEVARGGQVVPFALGGDIPFSATFGAFFEFSAQALPESIIVTRSIRQLSSESEGRTVLLNDTIPPTSLLRGTLAVPSQDDGRQAVYFLTATDDTTRYVALLPPQGSQLEEGTYAMAATIRAGNSVDKTSQRFSARWIDMPQSLRSLRFAIDALEYIMDKEELSHLQSADPKEQKRLFAAFWKARDKTPETVFNEWKDEYYRRVDHAHVSFRTLKQPNGVKTDRGKAYIFYGPPTSVTRSLSSSSASREIWRYDNLGKKLIFTDGNRSGDYTLTGIE